MADDLVMGAGARPVFQLGSRGKRLLARIVDGLLIFVLTLPLTWRQFQEQQALSLEYQSDPMGMFSDPAYYSGQGLSLFGSLVAYLLYEGILTKIKGATLGKMLLGLRVEPVNGGQLSWGQSIGRVLAWNLPNWVTCSLWSIIDSLWCLWDDRKQCLHDKMAKTVVVAAR